jgi:hypothetical protein
VITFELQDRSLSIKLRAARTGVPAGLSKGILRRDDLDSRRTSNGTLLSGQLVNRRTGNSLARDFHERWNQPVRRRHLRRRKKHRTVEFVNDGTSAAHHHEP